MRVLNDVMDNGTPGNRSSRASLSSMDAFVAELDMAAPLGAKQRGLIDCFVALAQRTDYLIEPQFILDILGDLSSNTLYSVEHRTVFSDVKTSLKEKSLPSLISVQRHFLSLHESGTIKVEHL